MANEGLFALSEQILPDNGVNHALIIGIGDYDQWGKLESPAKDANEISRILTEKYNFDRGNITLLTDNTKEKPTLINGSRKVRISKGSGTNVSDINRLLKQFAQMNKMMKKFSTMGKGKKSMRALQNLMGPGSGMGPF